MSDDAITGHWLGSTAYWTAAVRAMENEREDRLFSDPWAMQLAGEEGRRWIAQKSAESVVPIVLRTRFFDDFLQTIAARNGIRQIVLMAAGLDTRSFRLHWPEHTRIFELDQPSVLKHKQDVLNAHGGQPACARYPIEVDLTKPWEEALIRAGFEPQQPSGWLLEGFLFYLSNETISHLLDEVTRLAALGSWLGFDIMNSATLTHPLTRSWVDMQAASGAPWIGTMDAPEEFLRTRGWNAVLTQAGQPDAHHGRWPYPVIPTTMPDIPHNWFITAQKEHPVP